MRRAWIAAAWIGVGVLLYVFFVRISLSSPMNSGGANNALQAWDMLHGHLLLHGWVIGDASCYTFELPLYAVVELFFGLTGVIFHLVGALTYLIVVAFAVALACTNSRGPAMATRAGVVVAVLAAPNITDQGASILLGAPDHIGTSVFLLVSFLLIDRAPGRRFTPPLLAAILVAARSATPQSCTSPCLPSWWCPLIASWPPGSSARATPRSRPPPCRCRWRC